MTLIICWLSADIYFGFFIADARRSKFRLRAAFTFDTSI